MARPVLLLSGGDYYRPGWIDEHWPLLRERCEVRLTNAKDGPEWRAAIALADVLIPRRGGIDRQSLEVAERLRGVVTPGVGVERVDVAAATELGIVVANSPGNSITVAESTILLMLAVAKDLPGWMQAARESRAPTSTTQGMELSGKTLGLVGFGRIGKYTAGLARAFGMRVLFYDPYVEAGELGEKVSLDELMRRSDFVSLHPVLTAETRHIVDAEQLSIMKPTAYLINTSRGGVIDEPALIEALRAGRIAGAGLDVFETEPPLPDNPLLAMPNVICTPHGLSRAVEAVRRCSEMAQQSVLALIDGRLPEFTVNRGVQWRAVREA